MNITLVRVYIKIDIQCITSISFVFLNTIGNDKTSFLSMWEISLFVYNTLGLSKIKYFYFHQKLK